MSITVRKATRDDIDTIVRFNAAMAEESEGKQLSREVLATGVRAVFDDPSRGFYLVAEYDGTPAGCLLITTEWSDWNYGNYWWIQSVYVPPELRRQGVYKALHRFIESAARGDPGVCGLRLYVDRGNKTAKKVYESLGMFPSRYDFYEVVFGEPDGDR